jgi:putative ATP-binding cassette transporter
MAENGVMNVLRSSALVRLLRQHSREFGPAFLVFVGVSGLTNALLLATVNAGAENASSREGNGRLLAIFILVLLIFFVAQKKILVTTVREVEHILDNIRTRLTDKIRHADLLPIEQLGRSAVYASLHRETLTISQASQAVIVACQSAIMLSFSLFYLATISRAAFAITILMTIIAATLFFRRSAETSRMMHAAITRENEFFTALTHLLDGFKEARLNAARADDLNTHISEISKDLGELKVRTGTSFAEQFIFGQGSIYLLLGAIVFLLPQLTNEYSTVVLKASASVLFIVGPMNNLLVTIPIYAGANVAAENIAKLEALLEKVASSVTDTFPSAEPVQQIRLQDVTFEYHDPRVPHPFKVGPVNLTIRGGETLFIVGGNGSGKSTFLKVLAGLYPPDAGTLTLNREVFRPEVAAWYRSHFTAIFSDYHLFDRMYGLFDRDAARVAELLRDVQLDQKTAVEDGRFTTLDLSIGQRKRLALVVAMLEERPVIIFDEWAAEQDPPFRQHFYEELLPALKRQGHTIIAVTHDDRFFHVADRVLKMEYGEFTQVGA